MADRYGDLLTRLQAIRDEASAWPIESEHWCRSRRRCRSRRSSEAGDLRSRHEERVGEDQSFATTKPLHDAVDESTPTSPPQGQGGHAYLRPFHGVTSPSGTRNRGRSRGVRLPAEAARQAEEAQRRLEAAAVARTESRQEVMLESAAEAEREGKGGRLRAIQAARVRCALTAALSRLSRTGTSR